MSTLKVNNLQVGQDGTAANNYTLYQPASPDGTVRLGYGVAGSVTDILTLKNSRLGIGTDNPAVALHVIGDITMEDNSPRLEMHDANAANNLSCTGGIELFDSAGNRGAYMGATEGAGFLSFGISPSAGAAPTEKLRITSAGKVGINTISPSYKLHIKETTTASNYAFVENTTAGNAGVRLKNSQGDFAIFVSPDLRFYDLANSADRLRITNTGKVGIGVNPAAWHSAASSNVIQVGSSVLFDYSAAQFDVGHNYYYDGSNYKFISTGYAERITFSKSDGSIRFWSLGTGSADATATVTEKLRITVDGDMGLGNVGGFSPGADPAVGNSATVFEIRQTTGTNLSGGNNRRGAVLRLKHEAQWENGYQNSASDDLGRVEFVTGDASTGEGVRSIIRCRNLQYYNDQALTFEVAEANSATIVERLRITSAGKVGIGENAPDNLLHLKSTSSPAIELEQDDGTSYKGLIKLAGNDLEIRGSNGQLEFYTGNVDGDSSSLRGAITSAGHKWTHEGSIFHGSNDVTDFTGASRNSYNNVSIRAGYSGGDLSPTNRTSAIKIYPVGTRNAAVGTLTGGIAWQHLDPNNGSWNTAYGEGAQIWMGAAIHDVPGQERDRFNLWMNSQTSGNSNPNQLAIEVYPNGVVRHPKVPAFMVRHTTASGWAAANSVATWNTIILNNGNHWDSSNNRWTAPVDGIYHFTCQILSNNNSRAFHHLRLNGIRVDGTRTESYQGTSYQTVTFVATINVGANDNVDVYIGTNGAYGSIYANFNGFLVG